MSKLTTAQRSVGLAASLLGISEAIAWFVMSLLCIIQYNKNNPPKNINSYADWVDYYIYLKYLYKNGVVPSGTIVTPVAFSIFMWVYLIIDILWFIASAILIFGVQKNKITLPSILFNWGLLTCCICCIDLVLVILIGYDYDQICMKQKRDLETQRICTDAMIPILFLAAKGFVLWLLNLIFAYLTFVIALHLTKDAREDSVPAKNGGQPRVTQSKDFHSKQEDVIPIPRATIQRSESLYLQQLKNLSSANNWNVNLRTAYDIRTPPSPQTTPLSINSSQQQFFNK